MDGTVAAHLPKFKSHFVPNGGGWGMEVADTRCS